MSPNCGALAHKVSALRLIQYDHPVCRFFLWDPFMNQMRHFNKKGVQAVLGVRVGPAVISLLNMLFIEHLWLDPFQFLSKKN